MNYSTSKLIIILLFLSAVNTGYAQKIEAEMATLTNGASKTAGGSTSGGYYVSQGEGNLSFSVNIAVDGYYNLYFQMSSPSGFKANNLFVDGSSITFTINQTNIYIRQKVSSFLKLTAGTHKVDITKSWGLKTKLYSKQN